MRSASCLVRRAIPKVQTPTRFPPFPELTVTTFDLAPQITHDSHEAMKGWDHNKSTGSAADSRILFLFTLFPSRNEPFNVDTVGVKAIL